METFFWKKQDKVEKSLTGDAKVIFLGKRKAIPLAGIAFDVSIAV